MPLIQLMIRGYLYLPYFFHKLTATGPFGVHAAEYLPQPFTGHGNPLKQALWRHHVKQFHEASCSVASVAACVNALLAEKSDRPAPLSQMDMLKTVNTANWKERMEKNGHKGRRGLPLPLLGEVMKSSLNAHGVNPATVETVQIPDDCRNSAQLREVLWNRLSEFETLGNGLIIAHFDQGKYVPTLNIPHISPVGAFDAASGRVTILDVDPDQVHPYTISFDTFWNGLSSNYHHVLKPFGYGRGGYVYIMRHE